MLYDNSPTRAFYTLHSVYSLFRLGIKRPHKFLIEKRQNCVLGNKMESTMASSKTCPQMISMTTKKRNTCIAESVLHAVKIPTADDF